jgi:AcrR family transcriptional regulator
MSGISGYFFGASGEIVADMKTSGGKKRKGTPVCPIAGAGARAFDGWAHALSHRNETLSCTKRAVSFRRESVYDLPTQKIIGKENRMGGDPRKSIGARRNPDSAEAILDAAEAVLVEAGYSGFSIEAVARRARAGKPTIYRWWPSKAALLFDVYQRLKRVDNPDTGNLEDDLVGFLKSLFSHWRETPSGSIFRSLIAEAQSDATVAAVLAEYTKGRHAHTGQMIERAKARGEVAADVDSTLVADLVASFAWTHLLTNRLDEDETTLRKAIGYVVQGIALPANSPPAIRQRSRRRRIVG